MKSILSFFTLCLFIVPLSSSQNVINGTLVAAKSKRAAVDAVLKSYEVYEMSIQKEALDMSSVNNDLQLHLGSDLYEMNLFTNNLTLRYESENPPLLLGGSLRKGGKVSLTINDNFIYGYIDLGTHLLFIEPLSLSLIHI